MKLKITKTNSDTNYYIIKDIDKNESSIELYKDKFVILKLKELKLQSLIKVLNLKNVIKMILKDS